jgi:hypothetical protein
MILRRITEHVKAQNWFAVGIDFVIVVVGVFIGIQVANWNDERLQAREGAQFTERLQADLRREHANWQALVAYLGVVRDNADSAAAILEGRVESSDEALLIHAYRATQYMYSVRWRATYEELTSTGSLGLIKDQGLRDSAVLFYRWQGIEDAFEEGSGSRYRSLFRGLLPILVQDALTQRCGDQITYLGGLGMARLQLDHACETGLTPTQVAAAAAQLREHPDVLPTLRLRAMNLRTSISNLTDSAADIAEGLRPFVEAAP